MQELLAGGPSTFLVGLTVSGKQVTHAGPTPALSACLRAGLPLAPHQASPGSRLSSGPPHAPEEARGGLAGAVSFSDQKAPEKLKKGFSPHPIPLLLPTPPMGGASYGLLLSGGSSEAGSDMFSEPVTVSCGFLLPSLGRSSCNRVGRTTGQESKHLLRCFSPGHSGRRRPPAGRSDGSVAPQFH